MSQRHVEYSRLERQVNEALTQALEGKKVLFACGSTERISESYRVALHLLQMRKVENYYTRRTPHEIVLDAGGFISFKTPEQLRGHRLDNVLVTFDEQAKMSRAGYERLLAAKGIHDEYASIKSTAESDDT